jgi:hypothetical protein
MKHRTRTYYTDGQKGERLEHCMSRYYAHYDGHFQTLAIARRPVSGTSLQRSSSRSVIDSLSDRSRGDISSSFPPWSITVILSDTILRGSAGCRVSILIDEGIGGP